MIKLTLITATRNRAEKLAGVALQSVLTQTNRDFKWVIVNDGRDVATRELVAAIQADFAIAYSTQDNSGWAGNSKHPGWAASDLSTHDFRLISAGNIYLIRTLLTGQKINSLLRRKKAKP